MPEENYGGSDEVKVMKCNCDHEYQDKAYGKKMRVHNKKKNGNWVCTVCRDEKGIERRY